MNSIHLTEGNTRLEVQYMDRKVWFTQLEMAYLYQKTKATISSHIIKIYKSKELNRKDTLRMISTVKKEGKRNVVRNIDYYSLEVMQAINYRMQNRHKIEIFNDEIGKTICIVTKIRKQDREKFGFVYFIQPVNGGLIKIGSAFNVIKRFRSIQLMSPVPLKIIAVRDEYSGLEKELHHKFAHLCAYGEWFYPEDELLDYITSNALPYNG